MKIRWKLLLVMLLISLIPMMLMIWHGQRDMQNLGKELAASTREALVKKANLELKIIVEEHARILQRERDLIEMALRRQVSEIEQKFSGTQGKDHQDKGKRSQGGKPNQVAFRQSDRHFRLMGMRRSIPLYVSFEDQAVLSSQMDPAYLSRLSPMVPIYSSLAAKHPDLVLWQITAFENGTQTIYPAVRDYPDWYDVLKTEWYQSSRTKKDIFWSIPRIDPLTNRFVFVASAPLFTAKGAFLGATSIMVPVNVVLQEDEHIRNLSKKFSSLLIRSEYSPKLGKPGVRILAREHRLEQMYPFWHQSRTDEWLAVAEEPLARLIEDIEKQHGGVIEILYNGEESIAAYGGIDAFGSALMLIVGKADMVTEAVQMERYVLDQINTQVHINTIILAGVLVAVICLALILSHSVTDNIQRLVEASRRIASGDFKIRVRIRSNDEIGELGRTFDRMVPELEERIQMKQSLDLAMQIQQNLLPRRMPVFDGLDIAAESIYCDETGGDFFDFIEFARGGQSIAGIVVGDVSGHGIPAALLMASARAFLKCRATQPGGLAEIINDVNRMMTSDWSETGHFLTLFYMELNAKEKKAEWIRAGHEPAFLYRPDADAFDELRGKGISMGVAGDTQYRHNILTSLAENQIILIGTDGVWETKNPAGEMFGKDRIREIVRKQSRASSDSILKAVMQELKTFRDGVKQEDDVTLVIVKLNQQSGFSD
ncbi:MAG: SpoIIE family protein phosphatase [Thermodesulfobacteriota bacterium]